MKLPETDNYVVTIGHSEEYKRNVYQVINKFTNVVEFETPALPQDRKSVV